MRDLVFVAVVAARFLVPLTIPRFPIPAIVTALVIDAADQSVFAAFDVEPVNYQGYDKALDIYYLTIAYISTIRNWTDGVPFRTGQFLWYFRLVGVVAFELSDARVLLVIFPNTFEYFFIFYEMVRLRWEPSNLSRKVVLRTAAGIWIFIKLPQEWWIHIARLDVTEVLGAHLWLIPVLLVCAGVLVLGAQRALDRLPPPDWHLDFDVDAHPTTVVREPADPPRSRWSLVNHPLMEKSALVALVTTIFLQLVPDSDATLVQIALGAGVIIVMNSFIGSQLTERGFTWRSATAAFVGTAMINLAIVAAWQLLIDRSADGGPGIPLTLFLVALLSLIVTLYDRYRGLRLASSGVGHLDHAAE